MVLYTRGGRDTNGFSGGRRPDAATEVPRSPQGLAGNNDGHKKVIKKIRNVSYRIAALQPVDGRAIHITRLVREQTAMFFNEIARDLARTIQTRREKYTVVAR